MAKVTIQFKRSSFQQLSSGYSAEIAIDNGGTVKIAPDSFVELELENGPHTVRAALPHMGNETYVAMLPFEVSPDANYVIEYSIGLFYAVGQISIREIVTNFSSGGGVEVRQVIDNNAALAQKKKRANKFILICLLVSLGLLAFSFLVSFLNR